MELTSKNAGMTPSKDSRGIRSKIQESSKNSENSNPNVSHTHFSPGPKVSNSPLMKSAQSQKSTSKNTKPVVVSPQRKIRQRKFVVAKKNSKKEDVDSRVLCNCKEKTGGNAQKCLCVAYENLRASQEEFFKNRGWNEVNGEDAQSKGCDRAESELEEVIETSLMIQDLRIEEARKAVEGDYLAVDQSRNFNLSESESPDQMGSSTVKRRRARLLEEARNSIPQSGSGKVMHLVKAFERLLSIPSEKDEEKQAEEENKKAMKWALPGLQSLKAPETDVASTFFPSESDLILTSENLGLDRRASMSSSWDSSRGRFCEQNFD